MMTMPVSEWIAFGLVVGALLGAAALAAEGVCRLAGRPTRWVWASALALTVVLTALAPLRVAPPVEHVLVSASLSADAAGAMGERAGIAAPLYDALRAARMAVVGPVYEMIAGVERRVPQRLDGWLAAAWLSLSALLLALFGAVYARVRRARRDWPAAELQGLRVHVAPSTGPAVVGLLRPRIVVPRWLLCRADDEQRMVLAHEQEHVRARDPLLLAAGCATAALLPWHPAVWWMLSRLRLSVELDCDRRLLGRGVAAGRYGTLLIDLAEQCTGLPLAAPALAERSSHLERRLLAMTSRPSRFPRARGAALAALAGLAMLVACEAKLPTSAEIERMDVASAEHVAREATLMTAVGDSSITYMVDGVRVTAQQAHAIMADKIASIDIHKAESGQNKVFIVTKDGSGTATLVSPDSSQRFTLRLDKGAEIPDSLRTTTFKVRATPGSPAQVQASEGGERFAGLIYIDGVRSSRAEMGLLKPDQIESVEVIKGERATALYSDPAAAKGVIKITTRRAGSGR